MNRHRFPRPLLAAGLALAVWSLFTWPLPRHLREAIPCTARNTEPQPVRAMAPGDHLQLLYHFWLAGDMAAGRTPLWHNLYEFNTGDDAARFRPDPYYLPFSLVYAAAAALAGRAFGWNLAGFAALWLALLFTWRLCRRFADADRWALPAALAAVSLPFGWIMRLGGSPTGFALCFVPAVWLGLDRAARDADARGGWLAGGALFLSYCTDLHVFYFALLAAPFWGLLAWLQPSPLPRGRAGLARRARAVAPAALLGALALGVSRLLHAHLAQSDLAAGRPLSEVAVFSPRARGLLDWRDLGAGNQIFVGLAPLLALAAGAALLAGRARREPAARRPAATALLLGAAAAAIVALALGIHGPFGGLLFDVCRRWIPKFDMIRQPAKIYCLMPSLGAVLLALLGAQAGRRWADRRAGGLAAAALAALILAEYRLQIRPGLCRLDREQPAYAAAAADAARAGRAPRLLILPLWPGNSHWASLYEHYVSLYRLRMVNGYAPAVDRRYVEEVFQRLQSANQGLLDAKQFRVLRAAGVEYVLLHEDAFPEQVSPFPVGLTLQRLLHHPELELLRQAGPVWAFRVRSAPAASAPRGADWRPYLPAHRWELERAVMTDADPLDDRSASAGRFVRLSRADSSLLVRPRAPTAAAPALRWLLRLRGAGELTVEHTLDERGPLPARLVVETPRWTWRELPIPITGAWATCVLRLQYASGTVDADLCALAAGPALRPVPGAALELPPPSFFHAGYTDLNAGAVVFRREREPQQVIFYAPCLPLEDGAYRLTLAAGSADPAAELGALVCRAGAGVAGPAPVRAGETTLEFVVEDAWPARIEFRYSRAADMEIRGVRLTRLR